ncbi:hypothetical protein KY348_00810 [Candidatus Woesearchaeota archaeon]|nr:hypothetical protein [Candidatus Woesearchaeota archaeon]
MKEIKPEELKLPINLGERAKYWDDVFDQCHHSLTERHHHVSQNEWSNKVEKWLEEKRYLINHVMTHQSLETVDANKLLKVPGAYERYNNFFETIFLYSRKPDRFTKTNRFFEVAQSRYDSFAEKSLVKLLLEAERNNCEWVVDVRLGSGLPSDEMIYFGTGLRRKKGK